MNKTSIPEKLSLFSYHRNQLIVGELNFIYESNKTGRICFVSNQDEAITALAR